MTKLQITQKQYNKILSEGINERKLIIESDKEVILGVALLIGVNLTGLNKEMATKYISDKKIMSKIKKTLSNDFSTNELIKGMEEKGMKNVKTKLTTKAEDLVKNFDKMCGVENHDADMNIKIINNLTNL